MLDSLKTLLEIKSPTGDTEKGIAYLETVFTNLGLETNRTPKGALIATKKGKDSTKAITLSAHIDTLGAMVKSITSEGRLRLTQLGGYAWSTIEGTYVTVSSRSGNFTGTVLLDQASSHVHGAKTNTETRSEHNLSIRLDEVASPQDLGIQVGDFVHFDPRVEITASGFIKSRHLDDKACVQNCIDIATQLQNETLNYDLHFFISNYEEVGHGASAGMPHNTTELLVLDMAAMGQGQTSDEFHVTICAKDSSGPYDLKMKHRLEDLAITHEIPFKIDIYPFYGSDGSAAWRAGSSFPVALIGPGVDASHSFERTHVKAIQATTDLAYRYIMDFNQQ